MNQSIDQLSINTIRTLSMDAVQQANSGHPGTPMSMAPVMYGLWQRHLRYNPADPLWPNRDRFVLSIGHASMLLYATLHLAGVRAVDAKQQVLNQPALTLDDLKNFRQLDSKCPAHPEYRWTSGVETTTGPLGQGSATSVGMALASRWAAARFNRPGFEMFDFVTDECHQVFVPTRSAEVLDVVADAVGALAGAGGAWAWRIYFTPGRPSATRHLDHPRQTNVVRKHHRDPRRAGGDRRDQPASRPERAERPDD